MRIVQGNPKLMPVLLVRQEFLSPLATFTRSTSGWFVNSSGVWTQAGINVPRYTYNRTTRAYEGLLVEPGSTNLFLNSATGSTQSITLTAVPHTLAFEGTGSITLSGTATGTLNGTGVDNRVELVFTPTAGSVTFTVTGTCSRVQVEALPFATSYIETSSAAVARAEDVCTIPWNSPAATLIASYTSVLTGSVGALTFPGVLTFSGPNPSTDDIIGVYTRSGGNPEAGRARAAVRIASSSVLDAVIGAGIQLSTPRTLANAYDGTGQSIAAGGSVATRAGSAATITQVVLAGQISFQAQVPRRILSARVLPYRMSDTQLAQVTA